MIYIQCPALRLLLHTYPYLPFLDDALMPEDFAAIWINILNGPRIRSTSTGESKLYFKRCNKGFLIMTMHVFGSLN